MALKRKRQPVNLVVTSRQEIFRAMRRDRMPMDEAGPMAYGLEYWVRVSKNLKSMRRQRRNRGNTKNKNSS